jgi:hypothetical protein
MATPPDTQSEEVELPARCVGFYLLMPFGKQYFGFSGVISPMFLTR